MTEEDKDDRVELRVNAQTKALWANLAARDGVSLSEWLTRGARNLVQHGDVERRNEALRRDLDARFWAEAFLAAFRFVNIDAEHAADYADQSLAHYRRRFR